MKESNVNAQQHAKMTAQKPVQQLQIADQTYTENSQLSQHDQCIYLMSANIVYRASVDSNNSENFKTYQAHITDKIVRQEHLMIIRD